MTLLSTSVNNETNTKSVLQYVGIFNANTKGFRIICRNLQCICTSRLNLWMLGGGVWKLTLLCSKTKFSFQEKGVRGWGVTVKKITSSKTCHAWNVKINQLKTRNTLTQASKNGRKHYLFPQKKFVSVFYAINKFTFTFYF